MAKDKIVAIVLAAGSGKRMNTDKKKQYLNVLGKPLIYYSLLAFEESSVDEIILVTAQEDIEYCKTQIVRRYNFNKVTDIISGGQERYHSVYEGLKHIRACDYVLIHDGARPLITKTIIAETIKAVKINKACVVGMPVKDTIKITDENQISVETPVRDRLWMIQTPQAFSFYLIYDAYCKLMMKKADQYQITDDAMVVERMTNYPVKLIKGNYKNIKITTPEDLLIAEILLENKGFEK